MELRTMTELGAWVRSVRKAKGLSQTELAGRMGVTQSWVSRLERGSPRLHAQMVLDALAALGTPLQADSTGIQAVAMATSPTKRSNQSDEVRAEEGEEDPFADVFARLSHKDADG